MPEVIDNIKVGQLIKNKLKEFNMSQDDLAQALNVSKSAVSQNLNGKSSFDLQNLIKIAELFSISLDQLLMQKEKTDDLMSEYERLSNKPIEELKRLNIKDLNIASPDLYGKVFVEYLIDKDKIDAFMLFYGANALLFLSHLHTAKTIHVKIILFLLKHRKPEVISEITDYVVRSHAFVIEEIALERHLFEELNKESQQDVVSALMELKVPIKQKMLEVFDYTRKEKIMSKSQWISSCVTYKSYNILSTYMNRLFKMDDLAKIICEFSASKDLQAIKTIAASLPVMEYTVAERGQYAFSVILKQIIPFENTLLLEMFFQKGIMSDITDLALYAIDYNYLNTYGYLYETRFDHLRKREIGAMVLSKMNASLLMPLIPTASQDDLNFWLGKALCDDIESIHILMLNHAKFDLKYYNNKTNEKINQFIAYLMNKGGN